MKNKNNTLIILVVGIFLFLTLGALLFIWAYFNIEKGDGGIANISKKDNQVITSGKECEGQNVCVKKNDNLSIVGSKKSLNFHGNKLFILLPSDWGDLRQLSDVGNERSDLILPSFHLEEKENYAIEKYDKDYTQEFIEVNGETMENATEIPAVVVASYSEDIINFPYNNDPDVERVPARESIRSSLNLLRNAYENESIDGLDLTSANFAGDPNDFIGEFILCNALYSVNDRVAPKYLHNGNNNLRGFGFFVISGQDLPSTISYYKVVLVNLDKKLVLHLNFPVDNLKDFDYIQGVENREVIENVYDYLNIPVKYDEKMKKFMDEVEFIVSSIEVEN